jgi:A/G-specific adenine glycosylase
LARWQAVCDRLPYPQLRRSLLTWYHHNGRTLPWRGETDPYKIWISEIMLQQTQVKTVIPYYQRWLERFPTIAALAAADQQQVLKCWEGLGYYARCRNLHKAAQQIVQHHGGQLPLQLSEVLKLPGIGRTTAGGILSAVANQPLAILDGNVKRVLARLTALPLPPARAIAPLWTLSERLIDPHHSRDFNQAIMDLGATLCTPKQPACLLCPWRSPCQAFTHTLQDQLPMRETSAPLPHKNIGVAVIHNPQGEILIDRRNESGLLGGLWEFPGGKLEAGETIPACIEREIREELAIEIEVGEHLITLDHAYSHFRVTLNVHYCRHLSGEPQPLESQEVRWVAIADLDQYPFPKANSKIIAAILAHPPTPSQAPKDRVE